MKTNVRYSDIYNIATESHETLDLKTSDVYTVKKPDALTHYEELLRELEKRPVNENTEISEE